MKTSKPLRLLCEAALALGLVLAAGMPARGQGIPGYPEDVRYGYDPREVAMLPRYCIHTQLFRDNVPGGGNKDEIDRWYSTMGPSFQHMHHYCWGLMDTNRSILLARTQHFRVYYLEEAVREFDYVIRNATPDFIMLPEIFTKKGENLVRLHRGPMAIPVFERAIELKPDYWPPYAALSDYFKETGDTARAREWLEKGLSASPDTKALTRRLAELDAPKSKRKNDPPPPTGR